MFGPRRPEGRPMRGSNRHPLQLAWRLLDEPRPWVMAVLAIGLPLVALAVVAGWWPFV